MPDFQGINSPKTSSHGDHELIPPFGKSQGPVRAFVFDANLPNELPYQQPLQPFGAIEANY